jgi:hypothetical protein
MRKLIVTEWVSLDGIFDASSMNKWWIPFDSPSRQQYIQDTINNCEIMLYGEQHTKCFIHTGHHLKIMNKGLLTN